MGLVEFNNLFGFAEDVSSAARAHEPHDRLMLPLCAPFGGGAPQKHCGGKRHY